jgi:hypothetical protein
MARTSREGGPWRAGCVNSRLGHPPERGVPFFGVPATGRQAPDEPRCPTRVRPDAGAADRSHPLPRAGGPRPTAHQQSHWQLWGSYAPIGLLACPSVTTARRGHQPQVARHEHVLPWVRLGGASQAHNPKVAGSNPAPATNRHAGQARSQRPGLLLSGALVAVGAPIGHLCHGWPHRATELRSAQG